MPVAGSTPSDPPRLRPRTASFAGCAACRVTSRSTSRSIAKSRLRTTRRGDFVADLRVCPPASRCGCASTATRSRRRPKSTHTTPPTQLAHDDRVLARLAVAVQLPRRVRGRRAPQRARVQGAHLRADGCGRRRADHVAARVDRRRPQLGLPLHVDPRRHCHADLVARPRLPRRGRRVQGVARNAPRQGDAEQAADHVRRRRRSRPARDRVAAPRRPPRFEAGPHRQRRRQAEPARQLRPVDRSGVSVRPQRRRAGVPNRRYLARLVDVAASAGARRTTASGRSAPSRGVRALARCIAGWRSTAPSSSPSKVTSTATSRAGPPSATRAATHLLERRRERGWFPQAAGQRVRRVRRRRGAARSRDGPAARRRPRGRAATGGARARRRCRRHGLLLRYRAEDGVGRRGRRVPVVLVLARRRADAPRTHCTKPKNCSSASSGCRTTSDCSPRRPTPSTGEALGNFPQAFTHMALITTCAHVTAAREGRIPSPDAAHDFAASAIDRCWRKGAAELAS